MSALPLAGPTQSVPATRWRRIGGSVRGVKSVAATVVGGLALGVANGDLVPVVAVPIVAMLGRILCGAAVRGERESARAFTLSFAACVAAAGAAQLYAVAAFGVPQTTADAVNVFYPLAVDGAALPGEGLSESVDAPLAVAGWSLLYRFARFVGVAPLPWIGVVANSMAVALSAVLLVKRSSLIWGADAVRRRRLSHAVAWCGMFWLFGALHLRDAWVLLCSVAALTSLLGLVSAKMSILALSRSAELGLSCVALVYLRAESAAFVGCFAFGVLLLIGIRWALGRITMIVLAAGAASAMLYLVRDNALYSGAVPFTEERLSSYTRKDHSATSLGNALIRNQSIPIRVITGSGFMMINPIPLWAYFRADATEYHLLKGCAGVFLSVVVPRFLVGAYFCCRLTYGSRFAPAWAMVLPLFVVAGNLGVVLSSLETRHFGQFLPGVILIAVLPDFKGPRPRRWLTKLTLVWCGVVVATHMLWLSLRID